MRKIQAGSICRDNRGVSDFAGRETLWGGGRGEEERRGEKRETLVGHLGCILSAAVVDGGNVCCEP